MTNPRVNIAISEWFEPKPDYNGITSIKGYWRKVDGAWHPLEWDTDEAANAILLRYLLDNEQEVRLTVRHNDSFDGKSVYACHVEGFTAQETESMAAAIVETFCVVVAIDTAREG